MSLAQSLANLCVKEPIDCSCTEKSDNPAALIAYDDGEDEVESEDKGMGDFLSSLETNDCRIAMIGNVDAGKSTLIGCLTRTTLDDGRG